MLKNLISFKKIPLSNSLLSNKYDDINCYDLNISFDNDTKLVSVVDNVNPEKLFPDDYVYDSSQSNTIVNHFKNFAEHLQK